MGVAHAPSTTFIYLTIIIMENKTIEFKHLLYDISKDSAVYGLCDMIHPLWSHDNTRNLKYVDNDGTCKCNYVLFYDIENKRNVMKVSISLEKNENKDWYQHLERTEYEIMDGGMVIWESGDSVPDINIYTASIKPLY